MAMRTMDLAPLWRSTVGFDSLFDRLEDTIRWNSDEIYPPYNIEKLGDDQYAITLALAGFSPDELTITLEQNTLTVEGRKPPKEAKQMLYQGISGRPFKRTFSLAEHMQVQGASFENGLLKIDLLREIPEAMKPRKIAIGTSNEKKQIEQRKVA
jgi:molecular chaperone IbpA